MIKGIQVGDNLEDVSGNKEIVYHVEGIQVNQHGLTYHCVKRFYDFSDDYQNESVAVHEDVFKNLIKNGNLYKNGKKIEG
jgi:hypothetical protein